MDPDETVLLAKQLQAGPRRSAPRSAGRQATLARSDRPCRSPLIGLAHTFDRLVWFKFAQASARGFLARGDFPLVHTSQVSRLSPSARALDILCADRLSVSMSAQAMTRRSR